MSIKGFVKWFNNAKGYGFVCSLTPEGQDIFIHYSQIEGDGYRILNEGDEVEFDLEEGPKGPSAHNIRILKTQVS